MPVNNPPTNAQSFDITNPTTVTGLKVTQTGNTSASTSTGGAINLTNTANTGAGIVAYTNQDATAAGPLLSTRSDNDAFDQRALSVIYHGTTHGAFIDHQGTGNASIGLNVTSINDADTAFGVSGRESGRGTIKVTHFKPDSISDVNASAISINLSRVNAAETSAAQMIFGDTTHDYAVTTLMVQLRNNGNRKFGIYHDGTWEGAEVASDPAAPSANFGKLFFRDNGSGKTQLAARFPTGVVQVIATEP